MEERVSSPIDRRQGRHIRMSHRRPSGRRNKLLRRIARIWAGEAYDISIHSVVHCVFFAFRSFFGNRSSFSYHQTWDENAFCPAAEPRLVRGYTARNLISDRQIRGAAQSPEIHRHRKDCAPIGETPKDNCPMLGSRYWSARNDRNPRFQLQT